MIVCRAGNYFEIVKLILRKTKKKQNTSIRKIVEFVLFSEFLPN